MGRTRTSRPLVGSTGRAQLLRSGLANKELIIILALAGLVGLLMQVQTGAIDLGSLAGKTTAKAEKKKGAKKKAAPELVVIPQNELDAVADDYVHARRLSVEDADANQARVLRAIARMDGAAASALLQKLDPALAGGSLARLPPRDIARILDEAPADQASQWLSGVLAEPQFTPIPDELKPYAAKAGLYDNTQDRLDKFKAASTGGSPTNAADAGGAAAAESGGAPPT